MDGKVAVMTHNSLGNNEWTEADGGLILRINDGVAYATINRPSARNAMATPIRLALHKFLKRIEGDPSVRVLLLQGSGESFIAGGDIKTFAEGLKMTAEDRARDMRERAAGAGALCIQLATLPQPVIVAARGPAVGYGASIVFAADFVVLSETAVLRLSHVALGLVPDGAATWFLPRMAGYKRAIQIAMLGDSISADEALSIGLATVVVTDAELEATAEGLACRLAKAPHEAAAGIKQLLRASYSNDLATQVDAEAEALGRCALTEDYTEGLGALLEKRKPRFG